MLNVRSFSMVSGASSKLHAKSSCACFPVKYSEKLEVKPELISVSSSRTSPFRGINVSSTNVLGLKT
jgi:hypothetical protein